MEPTARINKFIQKGRNLPIIKPIKIDEKKWKKICLDYFINPLKDFDEGGLMIEDELGNKKHADPKELVRSQQNYLRKYNNPIELDKANKYPIK